MHSVIHCPICEGTTFEKVLTCKDHYVSHETFQIKKCIGCDLLITSPRPDDTDLPRYYLSDEYLSHSSGVSSLFSLIYNTARTFTLNWKSRLINKYLLNDQRTILDVGCGTGEFLLSCKSAGWDIQGVEPSQKAREIASKKLQVCVFQELNQVSTTSSIITLWHVLEHIPDLKASLRQLKTLLEKNGTLFIAVPNHRSTDAKKFGNAWAGYDVPRHLWHFSQKSMTQLLLKFNLKVVKIHPMKLDAFYVSILSEKYLRSKSSLGGFISGAISGFVSNLYAKKDNQYSSLIYVVRHNDQ